MSILFHLRNMELLRWIGSGPSIRSRARLALAASFLVTLPTLFIGVLRTESISNQARSLGAFETFSHQIFKTRLQLEKFHTELWRLKTEHNVEHEAALLKSLEQLKITFQILKDLKPMELDPTPLLLFENLYLRNDAFLLAEAPLWAFTQDLDKFIYEIDAIIKGKEHGALHSLSLIGRDQLILFLILLFSIPIFVGLVPNWLVFPLIRLKNIEQRILDGRTKELSIFGKDEISTLAVTLKKTLARRDEQEQRKSAKIFEIRNVLRAVISNVQEPILILDPQYRINYTNLAAAKLFGQEPHRIEGTLLTDHLFSPTFLQAVKSAFLGDIPLHEIPIVLDFTDSRSASLSVRISAIHEREGSISRVVAVLI